MSVKLLTEHHLEAAQARLSLHLSKCHIVGNLMPRLIGWFMSRSTWFKSFQEYNSNYDSLIGKCLKLLNKLTPNRYIKENDVFDN